MASKKKRRYVLCSGSEDGLKKKMESTLNKKHERRS